MKETVLVKYLVYQADNGRFLYRFYDYQDRDAETFAEAWAKEYGVPTEIRKEVTTHEVIKTFKENHEE